MRDVCQQLYARDGKVTIETLEEGLGERAVAAGFGRIAGDHGRVCRALTAFKAELAADRERARTGPVQAGDELPLPDGLAPALERHVEEVQRLCQAALSAASRQSEQGAQARIRHIETEAADDSRLFRAEIETLEGDLEGRSILLDKTEEALEEAHASNASLTILLGERGLALEQLDRDSRAQLVVAHTTLQETTTSRLAAEERAHAADLVQVTTSGQLDLTREQVRRLESMLDMAQQMALRDEERSREAERLRRVADERHASLDVECHRLRLRLEEVLEARAQSQSQKTKSSFAPRKRKGGGAP